MVATYPVPGVQAVGDLFGGLLGRAVTAKPVPPLDLSSTKALAVGVYEAGEGAIGAVTVVDVPLGAYSAAALSMVPKGGADDAARSGKLSDTLLENLREVLNVGAQLLNVPGQPRLVFRTLHLPGTPIPEPVGAILKSPAGRVDVSIEVAGYGGGKMAILVAAKA
jgi:hypothetical protein